MLVPTECRCIRSYSNDGRSEDLVSNYRAVANRGGGTAVRTWPRRPAGTSSARRQDEGGGGGQLTVAKNEGRH